MILSRFWYFVLALALGGAVAVLFVAQHYHNRVAEQAMKDALAADSFAVGLYLKDDARTRASVLLRVALDADIRNGLAKTGEVDKVPPEDANKVRASLAKLFPELDPKFFGVWAIDAEGRVIASEGLKPSNDAESWNAGGFTVVADALAGWIRDDTWALQGKLYRVVARPVERDGGGAPVGAIVGIAVVDDVFAEAVAKRTGAAIAFYVDGARAARGLPYEAGDTVTARQVSNLDMDAIQSALVDVHNDPEYQDKGRSRVSKPREDLGVIYARLNGEALDLGAGYAVGRKITLFKTPLQFLDGDKVEKQDTDSIPKIWLIGGAVLAGVLGLLFSIFEHTMPIGVFRREAARMAKGEVDQLAPSRFRGVFKKIAADINDGVDKVAAKGGVPRRAADLESVIGPIPAQPTMSAFAVPEAPRPERRPPPSVPRSAPTTDSGPASEPISVAEARPASAPKPPPPKPKPPSGTSGTMPKVAPPSNPDAAAALADDAPFDELADWKKVYEEYLTVRRRCGEPTDTLTFDKFKATLERNKAALVERHACTRVKFTVYEKDGKAALTASPIK
ncbi:MAG: MXAN_5187 family protein [Polyangiaceae bacterium]